jgi:hypothetical protein
MDELKTRWLTRVVGYDLRTQVGMLRPLSRLFVDSKRSDVADGGESRLIRGQDRSECLEMSEMSTQPAGLDVEVLGNGTRYGLGVGDAQAALSCANPSTS